MHSTGTQFCLEQPWFIFNAQGYSVGLSTNPAIAHFYGFQVDAPESSILAIPDGCVDVIIDCDENQPHARICGSPIEAKNFHLIHNHSYFGVRFTSGYVPHFSNLSPSELRGQEFALSDVVKWADEMLGDILNAQGFKEKCCYLESFLGAKLPCQPDPLTQKLVAVIKQSRGNLSMKALEENFSCSERTIQRKFKRATGMSPKSFCRILRYQSALGLLEETSHHCVLDIALGLGFSDQSHFQREFKSFVRATPQEYLQQRSRAGKRTQIHHCH